ncbi:adenylate/guanylate cyclase domain-containing protein [Aeromonas allosaccharophila]|uniref:nucleotide-binding domain-containing protein n=1 Tax=Aeromonas allosaccharophila TaxID=656 RepID=UPI0030052489
MKKDFSSLFGKASIDVATHINKKERKSRVYSDVLKSELTKNLNDARSQNFGFEDFDDYISEANVDIGDAMPVLYSDIKAIMRDIFNKQTALNEKIGCHPDFIHLEKSQDLENGYTVTMFFDIAGSTKLGKTYPPEIVFNIKNTIIKYVIEIIQAFDGHVHRIMGDAVMAFFRSSHKATVGREMDSGIDAINAGTYILEFMKQVVTPVLGDAGAEKPIGVRIGIDYAEEEQIVWGNYGASGAFEVTATSYYVDVAAKLQQAAETNKIMIGESLKKLLGLGNEYLSTPQKSKFDESGNEIIQRYPYVKPNYSVRGESVNYRQYVFDNKEYFKFIPYGLSGDKIHVVLHTEKDGKNKTYSCPCSESLEKGMSLKFYVTYNAPLEQTYKVVSEKKNTGPHAEENNATDPVRKSAYMSYQGGKYVAYIEESTSYHGLHHMKIKIENEQNIIVDETIFSLYILK